MTYKNERKAQNVWTKRQWESSPEQIEERKKAGEPSRVISAAERAEQASLIYRDTVMSTFESKDRRKNIRKYERMKPEERLAAYQKAIEKRTTRG